MANTTNLDLVKPLGTDRALVSVINANMDKIDNFAGNVEDSFDATQDGIAIVSVGDTHAAISAGQFVYVKNHNTLAEGLYTASTAIAQDAALSTSNLTADTSGGLNALNGKLTVVENTSIPGITLWKQGNVVVINVALNNVTTTAVWELIATLPVGFRPSMEIAGFYDQNSNTRFVVDAQGKLMAGAIISNKAIRFTGTFMIE